MPCGFAKLLTYGIIRTPREPLPEFDQAFGLLYYYYQKYHGEFPCPETALSPPLRMTASATTCLQPLAALWTTRKSRTSICAFQRQMGSPRLGLNQKMAGAPSQRCLPLASLLQRIALQAISIHLSKRFLFCMVEGTPKLRLDIYLDVAKPIFQILNGGWGFGSLLRARLE